MKFLIDAQLPFQLCNILIGQKFEAIHVIELPNGDETSDREISSFADEHDLIVITKDSDFYHSHIIFKQPKNLLLVTTGNIKNKILFALFEANLSNIEKLFKTCHYIEMSNESLMGHDF